MSEQKLASMSASMKSSINGISEHRKHKLTSPPMGETPEWKINVSRPVAGKCLRLNLLMDFDVLAVQTPTSSRRRHLPGCERQLQLAMSIEISKLQICPSMKTLSIIIAAAALSGAAYGQPYFNDAQRICAEENRRMQEAYQRNAEICRQQQLESQRQLELQYQRQQLEEIQLQQRQFRLNYLRSYLEDCE
jgi:hypothetical protein